MITKEEMERKIAEVRKQQQVADFGKQWFIEALSHTAGMVNRGEFPVEAHQVGQMCYQQFMGAGSGDGEKPVTQEKDEANKD